MESKSSTILQDVVGEDEIFVRSRGFGDLSVRVGFVPFRSNSGFLGRVELLRGRLGSKGENRG